MMLCGSQRRSFLLRITRAWMAAIAVIFLAAPLFLHAQGPGSDAPPVVIAPSSIRPILVDVEFEGNETLSDDQLQGSIQTRPTHVPLIKRYFTLLAQLLELNPLAPRTTVTQDGRVVEQRRYEPLWRMIDSLGGEFRYLNMTVLAADTARMKTIYNHYGHHDAEVDYEIVLDTVRNTSIVRFHIKENTRYPLRAVHFMGLEGIPADLREELAKLEALKTGETYRLDEVQAETDRVIVGLRNNGYAFADTSTGPLVLTANVRDAEIFPGAPYDSILVFIFPGERYQFAGTTYQPDTVVACTMSESLVMAQREYSEGDLYSRQKLDQTIENLYALQTYDLVTIDTNREISGPRSLGLRISTRLRAQNDLRIAPEVSWERRPSEYVTNLGLSSTYTRLNAFCTEGHLTLTGRFQVPTRSLVTSFPLTGAQGGAAASYLMPSMPFIDWLPNSQRLSLLTTVSYDNTVLDQLPGRTIDAPKRVLRAKRWGAVAEVSYRLPRYTFFNLLSARFSFQHNQYSFIGPYLKRLGEIRVDTISGGLDSSCDAELVRSTVREALVDNIYRVHILQGDDITLVDDEKARENFDALKRTWVLSLSAVGDHRDDYFSPTEGYLAEVRTEFGLTGGLTGGFIKGELHHRIFKPVGSWTWASRFHIGAIVEVGSLPLTPVSSRFSAGGASSLRGWEARDMLATRPPELSGSTQDVCAEPIVQQIVEENRRVLGGLALLELSTEFRTRIFNLPATSTLGRQLNELVFIGFADAGNAYFRDTEDVRRATWKFIVSNIGLDIGASLGYNTPVGPFRIGVGIPIYDPADPDLTDDNRWIWKRSFTDTWVWHVGIGHAF